MYTLVSLVFIDTPSVATLPSIDPCQHLLEGREEPWPAGLGALVVILRLIVPEARLLHAQVCSRARRGESPGHHAPQSAGRAVARGVPGVRQRSVRFDCQDLTVDGTP